MLANGCTYYCHCPLRTKCFRFSNNFSLAMGPHTMGVGRRKQRLRGVSAFSSPSVMLPLRSLPSKTQNEKVDGCHRRRAVVMTQSSCEGWRWQSKRGYVPPSSSSAWDTVRSGHYTIGKTGGTTSTSATSTTTAAAHPGDAAGVTSAAAATAGGRSRRTMRSSPLVSPLVSSATVVSPTSTTGNPALHSTLQLVTLRIRDVTGSIVCHRIHSRLFDQYEAKGLVLEAIPPALVHALLTNRGVLPDKHPAGPPVVIDTWPELLEAQRQGLKPGKGGMGVGGGDAGSSSTIYQLVPRRARNNAAYSALRGLCALPNSPFTMEMRREPLDYKMQLRDKDFDYKTAYNERQSTPSTRMSGNMIQFDGVLQAPNDGAFLMLSGNSPTPGTVNQLLGTIAFLKEFTEPSPENTHRVFKEKFKEISEPPRTLHLVIGAQNGMATKETVVYAQQRGVILMMKKGGHYVIQT